MKVFISFSGDRSRRLALALKEFFGSVLSGIDCFSSDSIPAGAHWPSRIQEELRGCKFGVLCITKDNVSSEWVHYEAGALSPSIPTYGVCPYLLDFPASELKGPLSHHQARTRDKASTIDLVRTLNGLASSPLSSTQLEDLVALHWPRFADRLRSIPQPEPSPLYDATLRGISLSEALRLVGLVDIETRTKTQRVLPPTEYYTQASSEVAVSGISASTTFVQHVDTLKTCLMRGIDLHFMILHPDSRAVKRWEERQNRDIRGDILGVIDVIRREGWHQTPNFHIRFAWEPLPFTAIMVDGGICDGLKERQDGVPMIRVQPGTAFGSQHSGIVLQFAGHADTPENAFEYFASDFRMQYDVAKPCVELFDE